MFAVARPLAAVIALTASFRSICIPLGSSGVLSSRLIAFVNVCVFLRSSYMKKAFGGVRGLAEVPAAAALASHAAD